MKLFLSKFTSPFVAIAVLAAIAWTGKVQAASFGANGYTNSFDSRPVAADWSTFSIIGASADIGTVGGLDTAVQAVAAATIQPTQVIQGVNEPPDANALASWSQGGLYLQTRPTGNGATLLMATLVNNSGSDPGIVAVGFNLDIPGANGEGLEGVRGYSSRTGAAGSWIPISGIDFPLPGRVTATVDVSWPIGTTLYLLFADDNGAVGTDPGTTFDNFSVRRGVVTPITITRQPQPQTVIAGQTLTLSVAASGTSPTYQWQKETAPGSGVFANVSNGNASNYVIAAAQTLQSGNYRVIVSNSLGSVTSTVVAVTVTSDRFGPRMVSAIVSESSSNQILLTWDERLNAATAGTLANYVLTPLGSTNRVPFRLIQYNPGPPSQSIISIATNSGAAITNNWYPSGATNYILTVNYIRDNTSSNNVVAPNSQIAISFPVLTNVFPASQIWSFHNIYAFDDLLDPTRNPIPWYATNFNQSDLWGSGPGPFYKDLFIEGGCLGAFQTEIGYQRPPTLFRTWFNWPAANGTNANLRFQYTIDDGAVFYLNGVEIPGSRVNMPAGAVNSANIRTLQDVADPGCGTNVYSVNSLRRGTSNLLAVAIYQSSDNNQSDIVFGMRLDAVSFRTGPVPTQAAPRLTVAPHTDPQDFRLSWTGNGFALESLIVPTGTKTNYTGPWFEVQPNMSNPYTNPSPTDPFRIYRLRKVN